MTIGLRLILFGRRSRASTRGPYLGEMRSVHGRPSIKLVGIGLSVSILPKSFHHFAFLGRVGV